MASFRDDFSGSSLDATRWQSVVAGVGAVSVTDSYVECNSPNIGDAAFFYYATSGGVSLFDKTKSGVWIFHATSSVLTGFIKTFSIIQSASAPTAAGVASWDADVNRMRIRCGLGTVGSTGLILSYWPTGGGARIEWNNATLAWEANPKLALAHSTDHYTCIAFENDAVNAKWRIHAWGPVEAGAGNDKHGIVQRVITDWINWSALGTTDSLWLVMGDPVTDTAAAGVTRWEKIEYCEGTRQHSMTNATSSGSNYIIKLLWGYPDVNGGVSTWLPQDRTTVAINVGGGGTWDEVFVKDPYVIGPIAGTYYCFYVGNGAAGKMQIGLATASSMEGTWTKHASNPVIARNGAAGERDQVMFPGVVYDTGESDPTKRWKCWHTGNDAGASLPQRTYYTTSADGITWAAPVLAVDLTGTGGTFEENGHERPRPVWDSANSRWVIFLGAKSAESGTPCRPTYGTAAFATPGTVVRSATVLFAMLQAASQQNLTANITNSRTITVADTSAFAKDMRAIIDENAAGGDYTECVIRKVVSGTVMEAYEQMTGFTSATPGQIRAIAGWGRMAPADVIPVGSEWWMYATPFSPFLQHATFAAAYEGVCLLKSSSLLTGWTLFHQRPVTASRNTYGALNSQENISTLHASVDASIPLSSSVVPLYMRRIPFSGLGKRKV